MYELGEYQWALMHLNLLRGATDKLTANDAQELWFFITTGLDYDSSGLLLDYFGTASLLCKQHKYSEALKTLDSVVMASPLGWGLIMPFSKKQGFIEKSVSLLKPIHFTPERQGYFPQGWLPTML